MADVSLTDVITYKKLVACGNGEVWYEVSAGTMMELNISSGAIDTTDQLNIFEAFQKVFIVNGSNLRVADFVNTKLTLALFSTAPTRGSTIIQSGSDATMIVDFVNTGKTEIYGYVTSGTFTTTAGQTLSGGGLASSNSLVPAGIAGMLTHAVLDTAHATDDVLSQGTARMTVEHTDAAKTHTWGKVTAGIFNTDDEVTGSGSGTAFTPTATDINPPVWYDWTVYAGGASGTMPTKAYLGCLYRGRNVLSGNSNYPHQWYMSKVADPFDWVYSSTDPLTAVAGNSADAGEIGDIVRALIPYKDDYLIFGCASTIWVLTGDPAAGGEIDEVDLTVGMLVQIVGVLMETVISISLEQQESTRFLLDFVPPKT